MANDKQKSHLGLAHPDFQDIEEAINKSPARAKAKFSQKDFADSLYDEIVAAVKVADARKSRLNGAQIGEIFKCSYRGSEILTGEFVRHACGIVTGYRKSNKINRLRKTATPRPAPQSPHTMPSRRGVVSSPPVSQSLYGELPPVPPTNAASAMDAVETKYPAGRTHSDHADTIHPKQVSVDDDGNVTVAFTGRWKRDDEPVANIFFQALFYKKPYRDALVALATDPRALAKVNHENGERARILAEVRALFVGEQ